MKPYKKKLLTTVNLNNVLNKLTSSLKILYSHYLFVLKDVVVTNLIQMYFCNWLFKQQYFLAIAYNMKGYDGVFIMN